MSGRYVSATQYAVLSPRRQVQAAPPSRVVVRNDLYHYADREKYYPDTASQPRDRNMVATNQPSCCTNNLFDFSLGKTSPTKLGYSQVVNNATLNLNITAYGYKNGSPPSQSYLAAKNGGTGEKGMGLWEDAGNDYEIDPAHFIQLDVSALQSFVGNQCGNPTITIGSVQKNEGFAVYGSNTQGTLGTLLYSFVASNNNTVFTVPLFNPANASPAPAVYKYISVIGHPYSQGSVINVLIESVTVKTCPSCTYGLADCAGVCGGSSVKDCAGVCYNPATGGKPTKTVDCKGVCGGTAVPDCAGVCNGTSVRDCAGVCYDPANGGKPSKVPDCKGVCGGSTFPDCAGVCGGDAIVDCAGVCKGKSLYDCAGVCYDPTKGPPAHVKDCAGVCDGTAYPDACGKCVTPDCVWDGDTDNAPLKQMGFDGKNMAETGYGRREGSSGWNSRVDRFQGRERVAQQKMVQARTRNMDLQRRNEVNGPNYTNSGHKVSFLPKNL